MVSPTTSNRTRKQKSQESPKENGSTSAQSMELSNEECLQRYKTFKTVDDLLSAFDRALCEKFIRGAFKANNGVLPCMTCGKEIATALGMVLHLNTKKCKAKTPEPMEVDGQEGGENEEKKEEEELSTPGRKSRRLAVKREEPDEVPMEEDEPVPSPSKPKRPKPTKKEKVVEIKSIEQLQEEPSLWLVMNKTEKTNFLNSFYGSGPYPCFAIKTEENEKDCGTFSSMEKAIQHNNQCIQPMYFTFSGKRIDLLRELPKPVRARYVREALNMKKEVQCLECPRMFTHIYGLIYHIERCNVDKTMAPWKCYRCGFTTTAANSVKHLANCHLKVDEDYDPTDDAIQEKKDGDDRVTIFGCLDDVNLRSGKAIEKSENMAKVDAQAAVEKLINIGLDIQMKRKATMKASVSGGVLPPESSRVRIVNSGVMRFRFRKAEITNTPTDLMGWDAYRKGMDESQREWAAEKQPMKLCDRLLEASKEWTIKESTPSVDLDKSSIQFRFNSEPKHFIPTSSKPENLSALRPFETSTENVDDGWLSMGYCGGPIHTLRFAPNRYSETEEVLLVCTYQNDASLVEGDFRNAAGAVQLWIVNHNNQNSSLKLWFVLESHYGAVLSGCWLDVPRADDDNFIGLVALGTAQGVVLIYRIEKDAVPLCGEKSTVASSEPIIVLRQMEDVSENGHSEGDENDGGQQRVFCPPIIRIEWSSMDEAQFIAGVNAAGSVVFWDLRSVPSHPKFLREPHWTSPALDLCFAKEFELVVGFREKLVRVYDIRNWSCILEENTVRTAGSRVVSAPRSLNGFLTFQSEYFASGDVPATGIAYVCSDNNVNGYFVVPLANRHDLQMWDASVCPMSGITATCGVDGQLLLSANGRVVPRRSAADSGFSVMRASLLLSRRRLVDDSPDAKSTKECLLDHESMRQHTWLDITIAPQKNWHSIEYSALELRTESLNAVATNHFVRPTVATGGQAGLLFLRPCVIDKNSAFDPLDLVAALTTTKPPPQKKKKGRPTKKPKVEEEDDYE